jgi:ammonium transporter, Amt family
MNAANTAFVLVSAALVMLMTPGLALFYGGMVRGKNVLGTLMQNFILIALIGVQWALFGYSLSFGPSLNGIVGSLEWVGLAGVGVEPFKAYSETIPHAAFMIFQMMFAIITPALITGAFAERVRFAPFAVFSLAWAVLVYNPVCHWIWGAGGWLAARGVLDFAGGLVVHLTCGAAALAAVMVIGPRESYGKTSFMPHNLPMTLMGTGLLWFGWFGFNGGSALAANEVAATAFISTHLGGMAGMAMWSLMEWLKSGRPTTLGAASGAIAGLATITPAAGYVGPNSAIAIGLLAGFSCYYAVSLKNRLGFDDSLDVVGIHGLGGLLGTVCLGLFASKAVNPAGADGLLAGNADFLFTELFGIVVVGVYAFVISWILFKVIDAAMGLRLIREQEVIGLDQAEHSESAYNS